MIFAEVTCYTSNYPDKNLFIMDNRKKGRVLKYLAIIAAVTAICWDIAVSILEVEPGTFRYESEFDALSGATAVVSIVTSDYSELTDPIERTDNPS